MVYGMIPSITAGHVAAQSHGVSLMNPALSAAAALCAAPLLRTTSLEGVNEHDSSELGPLERHSVGLLDEPGSGKSPSTTAFDVLGSALRNVSMSCSSSAGSA